MSFLDSIKNKLKIKIKNNTFFSKQFGFETGVDVTNDNQVLYRKNTVIKNIIFLSNIFYTIVFFLVALGEPSDWSTWVLTALLFPITFIVNSTLKKLIKKGPEDSMSQLIAMYVACFYMFLSAIIVYIKLYYKYDDNIYFKEAGYCLLYYSLAICAFYQDKKLLKNIFLWVFIIITILHFIVTYTIFNAIQDAPSMWDFASSYFVSKEFRDIILRSVLLVLYMMVLYIYVSMASYMQEERKKELMKRREVQEDFTNVVDDIEEKVEDNKSVTTENKEVEKILLIYSDKTYDVLLPN